MYKDSSNFVPISEKCKVAILRLEAEGTLGNHEKMAGPAFLEV